MKCWWIRPPTILTEKGSYFVPQRAVYGLRRSPRLWGRCRDEGLRQLEIEAQVQGGRRSLRLFQLDSEPNLWRISQDDEEHYVTSVVQGLVMTYVDDMVVVGSESGRSGRHLNRNGSQKVQLVPWVSRFPR